MGLLQARDNVVHKLQRQLLDVRRLLQHELDMREDVAKEREAVTREAKERMATLRAREFKMATDMKALQESRRKEQEEFEAELEAERKKVSVLTKGKADIELQYEIMKARSASSLLDLEVCMVRNAGHRSAGRIRAHTFALWPGARKARLRARKGRCGEADGV